MSHDDDNDAGASPRTLSLVQQDSTTLNQGTADADT